MLVLAIATIVTAAAAAITLTATVPIPSSSSSTSNGSYGSNCCISSWVVATATPALSIETKQAVDLVIVVT